jgi:hypothetical protein
MLEISRRKILWLFPFLIIGVWMYLNSSPFTIFLLSANRQLILKLYPHFGPALLFIRKLVNPLLQATFYISILFIVYVNKNTIIRFIRASWKQSLLVITSAVLTFTLCELALRRFGYKPGLIHGRTDFSYNDSLRLSNTYITDSFGIMRFSPNAINAVDSAIKAAKSDKTTHPNFTDNSLQSLVKDYLLPPDESQFTAFINSGAASNDTDKFMAILKYYLNNPLNADGFRSVPFNAQCKGKKKVLLIGDSFAYGFSARPITESFYDKLLMNGKYLVYNGGITSTDPVQYLQVARRYIPEIKPDYVLVSFFMGNDILYYPREPIPFQFAQYPVDNLFITANPFV